MYRKCQQVAGWRGGVESSVVEGRYLPACCTVAHMWAPFVFLFIFSFYLDHSFPSFSMEGNFKYFHAHTTVTWWQRGLCKISRFYCCQRNNNRWCNCAGMIRTLKVLISEIKIARIFLNLCRLISTCSMPMDVIDNCSIEWEYVMDGIKSQVHFHIELQRHLLAMNTIRSHR